MTESIKNGFFFSSKCQSKAVEMGMFLSLPCCIVFN